MARQYKQPAKDEKFIPFSIYLPAREYEEALAFIGSYECLNRSTLGRYAIRVYMDLVQKYGLDPRTLRPQRV